MTSVKGELMDHAAGPANAAPYRVCARCVMDTSDPAVSFDAEGICNHCRRYEQRARNELFEQPERDRRLNEIVARIKEAGRGRSYDCVLGVSGGVDSTMVAYQAKRLGLRPLAVHLDNGWNSELAVANIEHVLKTLDIDLYTRVLDWEEFRDLQLSFLRASVINAEIPTDHAIFATIYQTAARHGIRYILGGGNVVTEAIMPFSWVYDAKDWKHIKAIQRRFGTRGRLRSYPYFTLTRFLKWIFVDGIRQIPLLNYIHYDKREALDLLRREIGYREYEGKHYESIYTRFYQGFLLQQKFGVDKRRAHFSTLINSGQMTRRAALDELAMPAYSLEKQQEDQRFVVKKLGITPEEFAGIMAAPIRGHLSYPSNSRLLHSQPQWVARVKEVATGRYQSGRRVA